MELSVLQQEAVEHDDATGELTIRVDVSNWQVAARKARDELGCSYFSYLSAMDWLPNPDLDGEKTFVVDREPLPEPEIIVDPIIRKGGGASRFQLMARVYDVDRKAGLTLTCDLDGDDPHAPSWVPIYRGADWHERETWEMFGIRFDGHPGLRHIYLPEEFEGHPLRKDFPLLARVVRPWPGLVDMEEMPAKETDEAPAE